MSARQRSRWAYAVILAALGAGGCSGDNPAVIGAMCFPACRAGTVCSTSGVCVSACNPACASNEVCEGSGATARCVPPGTDAGPVTDGGVGTDLGGPSDVPPGTDLGGAVDVPPGTDLGGSVDAGGATDGGAAGDAHVPPMNCGMAGQPCCVGRGCYGGGYCEGGTCHAPSMRDTAECNSPSECGAGMNCGGPFVCGGTPDAGVNDAGAIFPRRCFHCETPPGSAAFGAACTAGGDCASGVCSNARCTVPCPVGDEGDAQCRTRGATQRCVNLFFQPVSMGPLTTLGVCAPSCTRDADCAADSACVPRLNYFADRMDFVCAPPNASATTPAGGACNPSGANTCRNVLCVSTSASTGYCTAPCETNTDCPAMAPICDAITLSRPSNMGQGSRACRPCRSPAPATCD